MEKNCNTCVNCLYDEERAHYKCWLSNKVIYNSEKESCDEWGKYAPRKAGKSKRKIKESHDTEERL